MTRRMMFVFLVMPNGITGWMLRTEPTASRSPSPKSQLACSGKLIRLDTGFCVCFARALRPAGRRLTQLSAGNIAARQYTENPALVLMSLPRYGL